MTLTTRRISYAFLALAAIGAVALVLVSFVLPSGSPELRPNASGVIVSEYIQRHALYGVMSATAWVALLLAAILGIIVVVRSERGV